MMLLRAGLILLALLPASFDVAGADQPAAGNASAAESELAAAARSLAPGEWKTLTTRMPGGREFFRSPSGRDWDLNYADSGRWDPVGECAYFYGSGHMDAPVFLRYCARDNLWSKLPIPPWLDLSGSVWSYSCHGYDKNALDERKRILYFFRDHGEGGVYRYDIVRGEWTRLPGTPGPPSWLVSEAGEYFPGIGPVGLDGAAQALYRFDEETRRWDKLASVPLKPVNNSFAEYSTGHRVMLFGGGNDERRAWLLDAKGIVRRVADAPVSIGVVNYGNGGILTADPVTGDFIFVHVTGAVYSYSPQSDRWQSAGHAPLANPVFTIGIPVSTYGVIMFVKADAGVVWLYRHAR